MSPTAFSPTPAAAASAPNAQQPPARAAVDKNMFLQLLVAQLRHQDPLNPADSLEFLTQLAQFQQLEESLNMGADLAAIRQTLETLAGGGPAPI